MLELKPFMFEEAPEWPTVKFPADLLQEGQFPVVLLHSRSNY